MGLPSTRNWSSESICIRREGGTGIFFTINVAVISTWGMHASRLYSYDVVGNENILGSSSEVNEFGNPPLPNVSRTIINNS